MGSWPRLRLHHARPPLVSALAAATMPRRDMSADPATGDEGQLVVAGPNHFVSPVKSRAGVLAASFYANRHLSSLRALKSTHSKSIAMKRLVGTVAY